MKNRYYVEIEQDGYDEKAYLRVFKFALLLTQKDRDVKRIVCYIHTKGNIGYFASLFDDSLIKMLLTGHVMVEPFPVPLKTALSQISFSRISSSVRRGRGFGSCAG